MMAGLQEQENRRRSSESSERASAERWRRHGLPEGADSAIDVSINAQFLQPVESGALQKLGTSAPRQSAESGSRLSQVRAPCQNPKCMLSSNWAVQIWHAAR